MRTFIDIVTDAARRDDLRPDADLALAAVLLDGAGLVFSDLAKPGVALIRTHDDLLVEPVVRAIRYAAADGQVHIWSEVLSRQPDAGSIVVFTPSKSSAVDGALIAARKSGCAIVGVAPAYADLPQALVDLGTGFGLPSIGPDVVEDVILACTGDEVDATGLGCVSARVVLIAVTPVSTGDEALAIIRKLADKKTPDATTEFIESLGDAAEKVVTRLRDLHGYGEAKAFGMRLAEDLSAYKRGELDWLDVDRGVLLSGPPGCGKTFFARALAAECDVPLIATGYSDWMSTKGNGDSASKAIKMLFDRARKEAPCIVFIDEIDSLGVRGENTHNESYWTAVINSVLAELDGASVPGATSSRDGVIVCAATNHPERVDPALRRAGRLDRHIEIPRPTIEDLKGVIMHCLGPQASDDGLDGAARACRGRSPADIAQLAREARRVARMCKRKVCADDVAVVLEASCPKRPPDIDRTIAVHEAGHALAAVALGIELVCVDADQALTRNRVLNGTATKKDVEDHLVVLLAGRAANTLVGGQATAGAHDDLRQATGIAIGMLSQQGLADGLVWMSEDHARLDTRVMKLVCEALRKADEDAFLLLSVRQRELLALTDALIERRYLDGDEVAEIVASAGPAAR